MRIILNGQKQDIADNMTLKDLLEYLRIQPETVVVEREGEIYSSTDFAAVQLLEEDVLEIVRFMGGG